MLVPPSVHVVPASDPAWDEWLDDVPRDVYHLAGYHAFAGGSGEGAPFLAVVGDKDTGFAWPYLLRDIEATGATDVSCVYGYPGPLAWGRHDAAFLGRAWAELAGIWREQRVVSAFTRFNPVLDNVAVVRDGVSDDVLRTAMIGAVLPHGQTVSLDCSLSDAEAQSRYNRTLRQQIAASRRAGLVSTIDHDWAAVGDFVELYRASMDNHRAAKHYYVDTDDVLRLRQAIGDHLHLMVARVGGTVAAAALNTEFGGIVQAHLIGINQEFRALSPQKVLTDDLRRWGHDRGASVLHLGGGLGGAEDTLFAFKKRFSDRRHDFYTGRWILDRDAYVDLCRSRGAGDEGAVGVSGLREGFFPAYRADRPAGHVAS